MFNKKWFWIAFTLLSIAATIFVFSYFPKVMSFISIDITMNREEALAKSETIAQDLNWGTDDFRQVAIFNSDGGQTYIELEGGGKPAFNQLLKSDFFSYYYWVVRNYKPSELLESMVYFKPNGEPYGFEVDYPEEMALPSLSKEQALILAQNGAEKDWSVDFTNYKLNDSKLTTTPEGRKDYTFIFERIDQQINEAKFRLELGVTGNKFSNLHHYLKIPESFDRRYTEMRSANNTIAGAGSIMMIIFYGILGIILGAFFLIKSRWLLWKKALFWGVIVALLEFIASFNNLTLSWIYYQTTSSVNEHVLSFVASSLSGFFSNVILLSISFMVGESLTRKAFGNHTQLWKTWNKGTANTYKILGNTIGAYLWVPISISYILLFYTVTTKYFGWWNSSSLNIDPNTLATTFPWLGSISMALHAGFWEECLFRAIPLAGAVLIGRRLGKERLFFWIGMIFQIVIFGMGHANYPAQPSYARVIELIFPSIMFAIAYLRFGLITGILIHFLFDAVLMGMPIWMGGPAEMIGNKVLFIIVLLIPVLIPLYRKIRAGKLEEDETLALNSKWEPSEPKKIEEAKPEKAIKTVNGKLILILGIIGLVLTVLFFAAPFDGNKLEMSKTDTITKSEEFISSLGISDLSQYEITTNVKNSKGSYNSFLWELLGKDKYNKLADDFFSCNAIDVRYAKFHGDLQDRAEEFTVSYSKDGKLFAYKHIYHEEAAGESLTENNALKIATRFIADIYRINPDDLTLKNALPDLKENRLDWGFTFNDAQNYDLGDNEAMFNVTLAGSELKSINRYVKIPEKTTKELYSDHSSRNSISTMFSIIIILLYVASMVVAIIAWTRKKINIKVMLTVFGVSLVIYLLNLLLEFNSIIFGFTTSEPFSNQLFMRAVMMVLLKVGICFYLSLMIGYFAKNLSGKGKLLNRLGIGFIAVGILFMIRAFLPQLTPNYPDAKALVSTMPFIAAILKALMKFGSALALILPTYIVLDKISTGFTKRSALVIILLFLLVASLLMPLTFVGMVSGQVVVWLIVSVIFTLLSWILIKKFVLADKISLIWIAGISVAFETLAISLVNSYNGAPLANLIAFLVVLLAAFGLDRLVRNKD